jgi:hypothetical protein
MSLPGQPWPRLSDGGKCGESVACPMLITEPVNEAFWPAQSRHLYDLLASPKKLVPFSEGDGADLHCDPKGTGLRDLRVFNCLDETWPKDRTLIARAF